ncbi:hypothetical protein GH865_03270 [Rhodocyclus tenuis]|uniref:hypothetical protein n=1 Tax=Rhodocyclus gracilis TaxID=2929842 RepID=UPI001298CA56|nr:hypothetical protein [Rhodocyclus gracilis]MRD72272.1 hypothetical protein [Rhodocyclus gracilis]
MFVNPYFYCEAAFGPLPDSPAADGVDGAPVSGVIPGDARPLELAPAGAPLATTAPQATAAGDLA